MLPLSSLHKITHISITETVPIKNVKFILAQNVCLSPRQQFPQLWPLSERQSITYFVLLNTQLHFSLYPAVQLKNCNTENIINFVIKL